MKSLDKPENRLYNKYHTKHTDLICNERTVFNENREYPLRTNVTLYPNQHLKIYTLNT